MTVIVFSISFSLKLFWFRIVKNAVNIHVFQSRTDANGKPIGEHGSYHLRDGSIHIDLNAGNLGQGVMLYTIAHEFTHFMEQQSPAKFQAFTDALFAELDVDVEAEIEDKAEKLKRQHPEQYRNASRDTLLEDARSEVVAEACETMLTDTDAAQRIGQSLKAKDATLFEKVKQWFRDLADKLRKAYKGLHPDSEIAQYAKKTIQQVDGLVQMWADMAVDAAENYRDEKNTYIDNADTIGVKYMARTTDSEGLSIKEQIKNAKEALDKMDPVATVSVKNLAGMSQNQKYKWAIDTLKASGFKVDRQGFGVITFSEKQINTGMNYLHSEGEVEALSTLPRVLKRGKIIYEKSDHKFRKFGTVTIAAPVTINGQTGYMGVVVQMTSENHYHTHRILMPDGSSFVFEQKNTAPGPSGDLTKKARRATNTGAVSDNSIRNPEPVVNQKNSDRIDVESDFYNAGVKYSSRVTDKDTLSFLDNQETITTYKTMQIVDGKLYPPMAARIDGKHEDYSVLGVWEQATEHPELIKGNGKFKLDKGKGQGSIDAAYNPYMHFSNLVINDQFTGAYTRDNLVTVECEVPVSELTSGYHAQYAKDSVGWHAWHTGTVAGAIRKAKGIERQVFLSRWIKPVRIVTDAEVASMYRDLLDGTDISVPDNVVTPSLLSELKKAGVKIGESGRVKYSDRYSQRQQDQQAALEKQNGKLREDVERLRELLKLQGKTTGGKLFKPESIKTAANFIMRETGRSLDADGKAEFTGLLTKAYTALSDENVTYDDIIRECTNVAQWLDENGETQDALDEYAGGILSEMKGIPIRLPNKNAAITNRDKCLERNGSIFVYWGAEFYISNTPIITIPAKVTAMQA